MDIFILIIIGVLSRLIPHLPNMTAVGALAVFSGATYSKTKSLFIVCAAMILTDMQFGFHSVMWATYGSLAFAAVLGSYLKSHKGFMNTAGIVLSSTVIFYLLTNFAVWAVSGSIYPKTLTGLLDSYIMALPFFRNSLIGDFVYSGIFFMAYEVLTYKLLWNKMAAE